MTDSSENEPQTPAPLADGHPQVLIVEDDPTERSSLAILLEEQGYEVTETSSISQALMVLNRSTPDLILSDMQLPDSDGLVLLDELNNRELDIPLIFLTGFASVTAAVQAIQAGATHYISKPVHDTELLVALERALDRVRLEVENQALRAELEERRNLSPLGNSEEMQKIRETVEAIAESRATVLITGESGTGKTMLARLIHQQSSRRDQPFVEVNCGALPDSLLESELFGHVKGAFTGATSDKKGKFEFADSGTLFLDEISTASPALQVKFLRVLQDRVIERVGGLESIPVDVRIILASNVHLEGMVREGEFREDLYYRINVVTLQMPPLRKRQSDILELAQRFVDRFARENDRKGLRLGEETKARLMAYPWPGNVRELENAMERAVLLASGDIITPEALPPSFHTPPQTQLDPQPMGAEVPFVPAPEPEPDFGPRPTVPLKKALEEPEKAILIAALEAHDWNRQETAKALQVNRTTLFHKMKKYGLIESP